jgi:tetratricopeptide (TPR) repeat protein
MDIAARSGARTMVHGSILGTPDDLALDAQLIDLNDGTVIAAERARGSDVFALADTVAQRLASQFADGAGYQMAAAPDKSPIAITGDMGKLRDYNARMRSAWAQLDNDSLEVRYQLVDMLEMMPGREEEARRALEEIIEISPEEAKAVGRLARIAIVMGDTAAADSLIVRYTHLEKDQLKAYAGSGQLLEHAARFEEARDNYRKALVVEPDNTLLLDRLTRTYLRADNPTGARREMEGFTASTNPAIEAEAHLLTGDSWAWEGRFEEALAAYGRAEAVGAREDIPDVEAAGLESALWVEALLDPSRGVSRINTNVWTLLDLGRGEKALNLVEGADRLFVRDSDRLYPVQFHTILYLKGRVYELLDRPLAAIAAYDGLLKNWGHVIGDIPRLSDAAQRIESLQAEWVANGRSLPGGPEGATVVRVGPPDRAVRPPQP